jgi:hypothetical protein
LLIGGQAFDSRAKDIVSGGLGAIFITSHLLSILIDLERTCPSEIVKKYVGVDLAPNTRKNHLAVLSTGARTVRDMEPDGLRPHCRSGFSLHVCWTVRTCGSDDPRVRRGSSSSRRTWISPPSRDPVRDESFRFCLRVSRPPMMPLDDAGPKGGEEIGWGE